MTDMDQFGDGHGDPSGVTPVAAQARPALAAPPRATAAPVAPAAMPGARFGSAGWAGAVASLAVTAGMAVWAVQLTMRDVSDVPVIRALEGPMRIAPENPGGRQAAYQGLALSDITSGGGAALAPDAVALAPDPIALDAAPMGTRVAAAPAPRPGPLAQTGVTDITDTTAQADAARTAAEGAARIAAPAPLTHGADLGAVADRVAVASTLATPGADPAAEALAAAHAPQLLDATPVDTPRASPRPRMRPGGARPALAAAPVPADAPRVAAAGGVRDVEPAAVAAGTRVAQLGAFDSEVIAKREWERLSNRFPEYLGDKSRMVMKARSGGRDFWRLRAVGFADGDAARRFCSALTARNAPCIPVTMR